ncbi:SpdD protein [Streptomyces fuscigenes]|uniref:SpdD protein n=1 Tax=Streptomyces fuscigenes TaxID=1528880 RepID=UPI001F1F97C8|nr:SpdD protein [Streptomyces fuscigenes]MCF3960392.1 SpdD protein [Streptomyces fuscigenes]
MFTPKYPRPDTAPAPTVVPPAALVPTSDGHTPACTCGHTHTPTTPTPAPVSTRPTVQLTPGALVALAAGGTAAVLVVGTVLVSMLLAVAVTGASVAVCAIVIRSLLNSQHKAR